MKLPVHGYKVKLQSVGSFVFPHGLVVPQGYDLKALESIGHLLAVESPLIHIWVIFFLELGVLLPVICGG